MIGRILNSASKFLLILAALALVLMVTVLCWQVIARYTFNDSPPWAEQTALLSMIWLTFLGAASGIADGFHIRIAEGIAALRPEWKKFAVRLANLLIVLAGAIIFSFGLSLVIQTWGNEIPTLPISKGAVYTVIPACGALMSIFGLHHLLCDRETGGSAGSV